MMQPLSILPAVNKNFFHTHTHTHTHTHNDREKEIRDLGKERKRKPTLNPSLPFPSPPLPFPLPAVWGWRVMTDKDSIDGFFFTELSDIPYGTGSLYVENPDNPKGSLRRESRALNATEREEATVVQYLTLGGHYRFTGLPTARRPDRILSSIHAGPGQTVFGYSNKQRADLTMSFRRQADEDPETTPSTRLHFHNYHGFHWHYAGHRPGCRSTQDMYRSFDLNEETTRMDSFRHEYAAAMSAVRPRQVTFSYHTSYTCDWFHDTPLPSLSPSSTSTFCNIAELLAAERADEYYEPPPRQQQYLKKSVLVRDIVAGKIEGFVTLRGGRERLKSTNLAQRQFGFCVQNFAPSRSQISDYTKAQIAEFYGLDEEGVNSFLDKQPPRTLNSTTFHTEETISTAYLRWLIKHRGFVDYEITHFLWYKFSAHPRSFIEPLLQLRHRLKKEGNVAAAEAVKLIVNSDYG